MKKIFELSHPKLKPARLVESIKHEVKKYIKRERNKKLPEGADFWDFDCQFGNTAEEAEVVHLSDINKNIDSQVEAGATNFYLQILAKPAERSYVARESSVDEDDSEVDAEIEGVIETQEEDRGEDELNLNKED